MTHLRKLAISDAPLMFEWMHDEDVVRFMNADFQHKTLEDCKRFIEKAAEEAEVITDVKKSRRSCCKNLHLAVSDEDNHYLGTVSLKNITLYSAEFAITMRKSSMGKGFASEGMKEMISLGHSLFDIDIIYWFVKKENIRAVRFYDKNSYQRTDLETLSAALGKKRQFIPSGASGFGTSRNTQEYIWYWSKQ